MMNKSREQYKKLLEGTGGEATGILRKTCLSAGGCRGET
jgi:hypothetical protein